MVGGGAGLESANLGSLAAAACLSTAVERSRGAETPGAPPPTPIPAPVVLPAELRCSLQAEWARQLDAERLLATALEGLSALDQAAKRHLPELEDRLLGLLKGCVAAGGKLCAAFGAGMLVGALWFCWIAAQAGGQISSTGIRRVSPRADG
eukprot:TRINITY_DN8482_c0_g1_i3.p2 TRINITY_DN8482_c0_g1~~TRINITY_DN8482_c0_g1_i3.p2  ORF type:complete len:177 (+),score=71.48 TRINITY_DN8482_c0_g1_i3:80-532(+)